MLAVLLAAALGTVTAHSPACDTHDKEAPAQDNNQRVFIHEGVSPTRGQADAPVTVVVFSDFQCPFCRKGAARLGEIEARYGTKVRFVYKHLPLQFHPHARVAAQVAVAAQQQGKFWQFHDVLFSLANHVDEPAVLNAARMVGVKLKGKPDSYDPVVAEDLAQAEALGVRGTPTFFVNGRRVSGAQPVETFVTMIDEELSGTH